MTQDDGASLRDGVPSAVAEFSRAVDALIADHAQHKRDIARVEADLNRIADQLERLKP